MDTQRLELKIEALRQRLAEITVQYEDRVADLRIEITVMAQEIERLNELVPQDAGSTAADASDD